MSLRGFGTSFDLQHGTSRSWYIDAEGAKRWVDNDELVRGVDRRHNPFQDDSASGESNG